MNNNPQKWGFLHTQRKGLWITCGKRAGDFFSKNPYLPTFFRCFIFCIFKKPLFTNVFRIAEPLMQQQLKQKIKKLYTQIPLSYQRILAMTKNPYIPTLFRRGIYLETFLSFR